MQNLPKKLKNWLKRATTTTTTTIPGTRDDFSSSKNWQKLGISYSMTTMTLTEMQDYERLVQDYMGHCSFEENKIISQYFRLAL